MVFFDSAVTGINGDGIQFGSLVTQITSSGIAGVPVIGPTTGTITFNDGGVLTILGVGMSFTSPNTFGGNVTDLIYSEAFTGGIAVLNATLAQVQNQIVFA